MSTDALREVFHHSKSKGATRCVLVAIADAAHTDGVTWLSLEPSKPRKGEPRKPNPRCLTHRANCSKRQAIRAIELLVETGEIELRKAQRGQRRINVYRVVLGDLKDVEIDSERWPFVLEQPFGRGANLAPRDEAGSGVDGVPDPEQTRCQTDPVQGDELAPDEVPDPRAREDDGSYPPLDPPIDPPLGNPSAADQKQGHPSSEARDEEEPDNPAADDSVPPSDTDVRRAIEGLSRADLGTRRQVEPLAYVLPRSVFFDCLRKLEQRVTTGQVTNDAGYLISLLRVAVEERRIVWEQTIRATAIASGHSEAVEGVIERVKRLEPNRYVRTMAKVRGFDVDDYCDQQGFDQSKRAELHAEAAAVHGETPHQAHERWIRDDAWRHPRDDARAVINSWAGPDVDPAALSGYHDLHDQIRELHDATEEERRAA